MTTVTTASQLDSQNPWPGLEAFQENAHDFFFGRDSETQSLLNHVRDASVTVLYGRSGLGKTSLLRAGLFPALRQEDFLPVYVRLELQQGSAALSRQLHQSVHESIRASLPDALLPADDETLWEYLHRSDFELWSAQNYPLTPVIVIDQFEELFTLGERVPNLVRDFMNDLGDLAENRIPADVAAQIDNDEAQAARYQLRSHNYKLLITMREDFLPHLEEWSRLIPALKRSRVRLLPLGTDKAFDAVYRPAGGLMSAELAERVVRIVAGEDLHRAATGAELSDGRDGDSGRSAGVEPALLSLFCRELNEERKRRGQSAFDEHLLEDAKRDILPNYYRSCVGDLPPHVAEFIESELITEKGFRDSYARDDAVPSRLTEEQLNQLIGSRLLRLEEYHGAQRIELTHDVLTGVVREHRDRRRQEEEKRSLREAAERHAAELDHERQAGRRLRKLTAVLALACVVALVAAGIAYRNWRSAENARKDADAEWLYGHSQQMLTGQSPVPGEDFTAMQMVLAANALRSTDDDRNYELLTALDQEPDLLKVIDTPTRFNSVAYSPDGRRIASAGDDGAVRLWDAQSGSQIGDPLLGHDGWVNSVTFSPDGTRIASGGSDNTVRLWDARSGMPIGQPMRGHTAPVNSVTFSPDGTRIASGSSDKTVRLWDAVRGTQVGTPMLGHEADVYSVAFSPDGRSIASGGWDKTVRLWDTAHGTKIGEPLRGHIDWVRSVVFSPDGTRLVSAGDDMTVRLWDPRTAMPVGKPLTLDYWVTSLAFSPDGARLVTAGSGKAIQLWDVASQREAGSFVGHQSGVTGVAFSRDGRRVVSSGNDRTIRVWDATTWQPIDVDDDGLVAWFSADGRRIYSGGINGSVRIWDSDTKRPVRAPIRVDGAGSPALFPFGQDKVLSLDSDNQGNTTIQVWSADSHQPLYPPLRAVTDRVGWSDDGDRIIAMTKADGLQIFKAATGEQVGAALEHGDAITTFDLTMNGDFIATGGYGGTVRSWNGQTGAPVGLPMKYDSTVVAVAVSPDGKRVAAGYLDSKLRLWDTATGEQVWDFLDTRAGASALAFSPDGSIVASGSDDGTIRMWDVGEKRLLGDPYKEHTRAVSSLYFSHDGSKLVSASADHTIRVWPVPSLSSDAARDALCSRLTHNMAESQWADVVQGQTIDYEPSCDGLPEAEPAAQ